jgi:uncharacterized membrane protein YebE (DUF533 family)
MFDAKELLNVLTGGQTGHSDLNQAINRGKQVASDTANQAATAVSDALGQAQFRLHGTAAGDYAGKAKEMVDQNPMTAVAALGGLAAILLGTQGGRSLTGGLVRAGGLAAIGALAYNAARNFRDGKPLTAGVPGLDPLAAPPSDSTFAEHSASNEVALLIIRGMVATAAADGVVDPMQRRKILAEMQAAGLEASAADFLDREIQHPATVVELAQAAGSSREWALQVYTAAYLVAGMPGEKAFVEQLARALQFEPELVNHIHSTLGAVPTTP